MTDQQIVREWDPDVGRWSTHVQAESGGGGSTPGALFVIEQSVAYTDVADVGNGNFMGPPITIPAGARLYGFGTVVETDFDDSGLSGSDSSIGCGDETASTAFNIALLDLTSANSAWSGIPGAGGFIGVSQVSSLQYKQSAGTSPNILSRPMVAPSNQPDAFPVEFATAGNLRLMVASGWQADGSQGLVRISYYVCAAPATSF